MSFNVGMSLFHSVDAMKVDGRYTSTSISHLSQGVRSMWLLTGSSVDRPFEILAMDDPLKHGLL